MTTPSPRARRFAQVDVFAPAALQGNPVAVLLDSEELTGEQMQAFTAWTNLSECTFVAPPNDPDADYSVRIFTGAEELPFAGHPTLGTAHAWLTAGGRPQRPGWVRQESGLGLVTLRADEATGELAFAAPSRRRSGPLSPEDVDLLVAGLGLDPDAVVDSQWCDNGPPWQALLLRSAEDVLAARPDPAVLGGRYVGLVALRQPPLSTDAPAAALGVPGAGAADAPAGDVVADAEVRAFFPTAQGLGEDPVTGSLNAALAQWLIGSGTLPDRYVAAQGTALGRQGRVSLLREGDDMWVGGRCVTVIDGTVTL
ncbi:MAG: PhzF family phenazine biosynthesis protein [Actinomycetales bacterium]